MVQLLKVKYGGKMKKKLSWQEKLKDNKNLPKVVHLNANGQQHWHGETMVVPAPSEVNAVMASVPNGKLITIDIIRQKLAKKHKTDIGCPLTSGIFSWIAAHAAEEAKAEGKKDITSWWRTLKSDGSLNPKFPGEGELQAELLKAEGHKIIAKGQKLKVENYEPSLVEI
jgi:alkylated DNA nucleotide flippase Atl1